MRFAFLATIICGTTAVAAPFAVQHGKYQTFEGCSLSVGAGEMIEGLPTVAVDIPARLNFTGRDCTNDNNTQTVIAQEDPRTCTLQVFYSPNVYIPGGIYWMSVDPRGVNGTLVVQFCSFGPAWTLYLAADYALKVIYNKTAVK